MATCDLDELLADACANGFICLDANVQAAIELQLLKRASGDTSTLAELKEQACANGFSCLDASVSNAVTSNALAMQIICNATAGGCETSETNMVPLMLTNTTPSGVASASNNESAPGIQAFRAFDRNDATQWYNGLNTTGWIQYQFASATRVTSYRLRFTIDLSAANWELQGSSNGSSWTTLDTQSGTVTSSDSTVTLATVATYAYYRVLFTMAGAVGLAVFSLELINSVSTCASLIVSEVPSDSITWTWNQSDPTNWSIQQSSDGSTGWVEIELADPDARGSTGLTGVNYYRVVVVGGAFDSTISNVVFLP